MGSGHFPSEGYGKAAFFKHLEFLDGDSFPNVAYDVRTRVTRPECYDIDPVTWTEDGGIHFLYGGPGFSRTCQKPTS
ncbi:hypothetical protein LINPERPRIM_LOCUS19271 [Linum perenne]